MPYRGFKPPPVFVLTYAKTSKKKSRITIEAFVIVIKPNDAQTLRSKPSIGGSTCIPPLPYPKYMQYQVKRRETEKRRKIYYQQDMS